LESWGGASAGMF